jgi:hypothetical protein
VSVTKILAALGARLRGFGPGGAQNLALVAGAGLVSHGAGRVYAPAGEILAGAFALAAAWLLAKAA